jgi:hypothetical protein
MRKMESAQSYSGARPSSKVRPGIWLAIIGLVMGLTTLSVQACSIPVFRYALDRWPADAFTLEVTVEDAKDEAVSKFLRNLGTSSPMNIKAMRLPADAAGSSRLLYPHAAEASGANPWSGALSAETLGQITNSPARAELVRRIITGDSAVWVLVESGDQAADDAAATALEKRLKYLEQVAEIPSIDPNDPTSKLGPGPKLQVKFSMLRVAQGDAREAVFVKMLAGAKADPSLSSGPWLAAVFGRGRVLGAWPAKGFGKEQVDEVCLFLMGACSCQVKNLNPGWDLLVTADWDAELQKVDRLVMAGATAVAAVPAEPVEETETVTFKGERIQPKAPSVASIIVSDEAEEGVAGMATPINWALIGGIGVLLVAGICFWFGVQARR